MAPIKVGNLSVEITVNTIDGILHELIAIPVSIGFWVTFTVKDHSGKTESFPLVDESNRLMVFDSYSQALHEAAHKLMHKISGRVINIKPDIT